MKFKLINLLIALVLITSLTGSVFQTPQNFTTRVHPEIIRWAQTSPDALVDVIVQKAAAGAEARTLALQLGAKITHDLPIIHAFSATMPARAALELAASPWVRWLSPDGSVRHSGIVERVKADPPIDPSLLNTYLQTLNVVVPWTMNIRGQGITVAVIDSGVTDDEDFAVRKHRTETRLIVQESISETVPVDDSYGHGTFVAGIVGGAGYSYSFRYRGIAPNVNLVSFRISDETGMAYESDVVAAMQWVFDNKDVYNIRVVNLSINSTEEQSYHESPMDAAAEILWFNSIVVVCSAGNRSDPGAPNPANSAPANDPFIITVGASDEQHTPVRADDTITTYSAFATTINGFTKPDIIAPGQNIISILAANSEWEQLYPDRVIIDGEYFRLSGTSMSAPMVSGAIALLLQVQPDLTPDQVKYRLVHTGIPITSDPASGDPQGSYPYLDVAGILDSTTTESANTGIPASALLWTGPEPITWDSVSWNSVSWNSVSWNSVLWGSVSWNSVSWNSVAWDY